MKIAFFTDSYKPQISGVVENVETSAKALRAAGHKVIIVAPRTPGYKLKDKNVFWIPSVKVIKNPEIRVIVPLPDKTMRKLLAMKFDVIHGHSGGPACFLGWEVARRKKIPYVFTYHTLFNRYTHYIFSGKLITPKMAELGSRVFCNLTDYVIAPTERVKKELVRYGVRKRIAVIPGGINLKKFAKVQKNFLRKKLRLDKDKLILLYVGRLGQEKNIDFILISLSKIVNLSKKAVFVVVGDGPDRERLLKLAAELKIADSVKFTGFISSELVPSVYSDGNIFLFASTSETQGLVIVEAMAAKLPILSVKDEAYEGVIIDKETGLLVESKPEDYVRALNDLLESESLRQTLGEKARKLVEEKFSAEKQAESLTAIYRTLISEKEVRVDYNVQLRQRVVNISQFLKINQRFNRFKQAMRLINGQSS